MKPIQYKELPHGALYTSRQLTMDEDIQLYPYDNILNGVGFPMKYIRLIWLDGISKTESYLLRLDVDKTRELNEKEKNNWFNMKLIYTVVIDGDWWKEVL